MTALQARHRRNVNSQVGWAQLISSWRRDSDEVRGDQLATAAVGFVCAASGTVIALLGRGTTAAVFIGLVTLCVTPGCAFACWQTTRNRLTRGVTILAGSLTWTILIATILAFLQVTSLNVLLALTAGIGGLGSAILFLVDRLACRLSVHSYSAPIRGEHPRHARAPETVQVQVQATERARSLSSLSILTVLLIVSAGFFAFSVTRASGHAVGRYGLLPVLGLPFFIAAALTVTALIFSLCSIRTSWPFAVAALALLLVEFNGTPMMLDPTPLSSWTFKHYGVVDYVFHGLPLNDSLDVYQQWPGFFASAAALERLSGRSDLSFANWAQLFYEALDALVVFAIARRLVPKHPAVPYVTVALFVAANWEGQFYFSPQSMAFLLALLIQFFLLPLIEPARLRRIFMGRSWLVIPRIDFMRGQHASRVGSAVRGVGIIGLFAAIMVTHQLSPFMVFAGLACLWILGLVRQSVVMLVVTVIVIGYPALHLSVVSQNSVLDGFSFSNIAGGVISQPSQQQKLASLLARSVSLGMWALTGVSLISYWRRFGQVIIPAIFCAVPFGFVLISDYQGEAIYRVFLFSSPWCALIIAKRLAELNRLPMMCWTLAGAWALFSALGSAQAQDFGMYPIMKVQSSEVAVSDYFLNNAPDGSGLALAVSNFPSRGDFKYSLHNVSQSQNDLGLDQVARYTGNGLSRTSAKSLATVVAGMENGRGYLAVGPSMESDSAYYGIYSSGTLPKLVKRLESSPYWEIWYKSGNSIIFKAFPQGKPSGKGS